MKRIFFAIATGILNNNMTIAKSKKPRPDTSANKHNRNDESINNHDKNNNSMPKPIVARISLWTTRNNAKLTTRAGHDSGRDSGDSDSDSDGDDDDEYADDLELDENAQLEQRLKQANLPEHVRKITQKELQKLRRTPSFMSDYAVTRSYLELISELPWNEASAEVIDLKKSRRDLDNDHYGMQKLKERVLQYLAVRKLKQHTVVSAQRHAGRSSSAQPILMFVGPPGTGKTSIAQSIASSLGRKFQRISLGGVADQSAVRGHRRTYIGSMPGRIIQGIKQAGVNNPVFLLDELDKMSAGPQGDPSGALLEVLDPEQNHTFTDHYLNIPFDLSRVLFIATANSIDTIPAALLDRMEVIQIAGYTHDEKFNIARKHLVPKQVIDNGLRPNMIVFKDDAVHKIITSYAREAGVRTLERRIASICRVVAVRIVESTQAQLVAAAAVDDDAVSAGVLSSTANIAGAAAGAIAAALRGSGSQQAASSAPTTTTQLPVVVDAASLESYLGPVVYDRESSARTNVPGVAIGLAWTANGGEITFVEAEIMHGSKREGLVLTGQLGSVMRESAVLALNWIRANFHLYDLLPQTLGRDLVDNTVHIHFPAGGVGKDGPSAGVTIVVALMSLCSNMSVVPDLAMTGEITLRGVVLKVGGVKSKVLAAHRAGIKRIILPKRNETDMNEISPSVRDKLKIHFVSTIDEVIRIAFDNKLLAKSSLNIASSSSSPSPARIAGVDRDLTSKM